MYSVFIVDDEVIVREGLRTKINWDNSNFYFAGEAPDGEIALSMIQDIKPDILITDIKMPFMDGLQLAQKVKKNYPWIKIIILSGHDEFDYAKKAISIGVEEYILKPFTSQQILTSLQKISKIIDKEKQNYTDISKMKEILQSNEILRKEKLLTDFLLGYTPMHLLKDIDINGTTFTVTISQITNIEKTSEDLIKIKSILLSTFTNKDNFICFFISPQNFVCILTNHSTEDIYNIANTIEHEISTNTNCNVITAIGSTETQKQNIPLSFNNAQKILNNYFTNKKNKIISISDIQKNIPIENLKNDPLINKLKFTSENEIEIIINQYLNYIEDSNQPFPVVASYLVMDVIISVSKFIEDLGGNIKDIMGNILSHEFISKITIDEQTLISEIKNILTLTLDFRDKTMHSKYCNVIINAKKYINENFNKQDICLQSVAEYVNLSPNHFSTIFSQECGTTFIEYLTQIRIEQAKKLLLNTNIKTSDIAYECGFNDSHYFSYIFKKITNITPREFRQSKQNNN